MNDRERFIAALTFQKPDRVPFEPGTGRKSTREVWYRQGCPEDKDPHAYARELAGVPPSTLQTRVTPDVDFRMIPQFEEKIIERRADTLIVQDWKGNICEISNRFDVSYLREPTDFVTRSWIKCPVETRPDWDDMQRRYVVGDVRRFPTDWAERCRQLRARDYASRLTISGPFWQLREWLGFENLCMALLDDPDFCREMIGFWEQFVADLLTRVLREYTPDQVMINEDMAYKEKPMIGPDMCRRFLLHCWRTWADICRGSGVPIFEVDSDGHAGELIPVWIEAGFQSNSPQEVAAGNDLIAYRRKYGVRMAYRGGVDKRAIAKGGAAIRAEIRRIQPVIDDGGFIPSCDHGIPHDVSWPNFLDYCRLLAQATGWTKTP